MPPIRQHAASARSILIVSSSPERAGQAARALVDQLSPATSLSLVLFASGELAAHVDRTALAVRAALPSHVTAVLATGAGVLSDQGAHEGVGALAGIGWSGRASTFRIDRATGAEGLAGAIAQAVVDRVPADDPCTVLLFVRPSGFGPHTLEALSAARPRATVIGGGTLAAGPVLIAPQAPLEPAASVGVLLTGAAARLVVRSADACRALHLPMQVTDVRGPMVLGLDGQPALDVLTTAARALDGQPLVLAMFGPPIETDRSSIPGVDPTQGMLVRPIRGVDPVRRGVFLGDGVRTGMRFCFGVYDPGVAQRKLETASREVDRELAGGVPRFGVLVRCGGWAGISIGTDGSAAGFGGGSLSGADAAARVVKGRFAALPFAGMLSPFEMASSAGGKPMQLWYSAVLGVASAPS